MAAYTYIMTNKPRGVLYIGVTAYLAHRIDQHRRDRGSAFCRKYGLHRLVLVEPHDGIAWAIAREKARAREGAEGVETRLEDRADRGDEP